jgi:hypothetical protein
VPPPPTTAPGTLAGCASGASARCPPASWSGPATIGLGAWWLFAHVVSPIFTGSGPGLGHLPIGFVLVAFVALIGTVAAWRVAVPSAPFLIVRALLTGLVWLALAAYGAALLAS